MPRSSSRAAGCKNGTSPAPPAEILAGVRRRRKKLPPQGKNYRRRGARRRWHGGCCDGRYGSAASFANPEHAMSIVQSVLAAALAASFAAAATAQTSNPNPPPPNPAPSHPAPLPQDTTPQDRTPRSGTTGQRDQHDPTGKPAAGRSQGGPLPFESLDRTHQGYVTRDAARGDPWLARRFERCDADRDARVTRAEYDACTQAPGPGR
jgi:hypothetical protein